MITVKTGMYTEDEKKALFHVLQKANNDFDRYCNPMRRCDACEYRHLCADLENARAYAHELKQGVEK